jgi:hypothetical protein
MSEGESMTARFIFAVACLATAAAWGGFAVASARGGGGVTPYASGNQVIASSPGVYAQTTDEYAGSWSWSQQSASYDYYWYVFRSNGVLAGSGHKASGGGGSWSGTPTIYFLKEYNNEPLGSGHNNILSVDYCC